MFLFFFFFEGFSLKMLFFLISYETFLPVTGENLLFTLTILSNFYMSTKL